MRYVGNMNDTEIEKGVVEPIEKAKKYNLVDVMIAFVGISFIASVAVPVLQHFRQHSQNAQFTEDISVFRAALQNFKQQHGNFLTDSEPGNVHSTMTAYIDVSHFETLPSIGGMWDIEMNNSGVISAVGVYNPTVSKEQLALIDEMIDDGDIASGQLRFISNNCYSWVLEEKS